LEGLGELMWTWIWIGGNWGTVGEGERPKDVELSTEGRLIERLIIIILKVDCGGDRGDDEEIDITRLCRWRREEVEGEVWGRFKIKINEVDAVGVIKVLESRVEKDFRCLFRFLYCFYASLRC